MTTPTSKPAMASSTSKLPSSPSTDDTSSASDSDEAEGSESEAEDAGANEKEESEAEVSEYEAEDAEANEEEEDAESSDSESDKAPPAPEPEGKKGKLAPSAEAKNPPPSQRIWSVQDEVRILEALAAHRREHGSMPQPGELLTSLDGRLDYKDPSRKEVSDKVSKLKSRYAAAAAKKGVPGKEPKRRLYHLSRIVWGAVASDSGERRGFEEMCELYPYLGDEVRALDSEHPGLYKRPFEKMADDTARALDAKVKKQRRAAMKLEVRRVAMLKKVVTTLANW